MSSNVSDSQPYVLTYSMSTYEAGGFNSPSSWNAGGQALHGILHNPPNQEQTMEKKAIIFGVTGQDGSHLADLLLEKNYQVIGVGRRVSVDNTERLKHLKGNEKFQMVQGDITDAYSIRGVFKSHKDVNEVYNLAAQSHVAVHL